MTFILSISPRLNRAKWVLKKLYHDKKEALTAFDLACTLNLGEHSKTGKQIKYRSFYLCGYNENNIVELKNI